MVLCILSWIMAKYFMTSINQIEIYSIENGMESQQNETSPKWQIPIESGSHA